MSSLVIVLYLGALAFADEKDFVQLDQNKDSVWSRRECDGSAAAVQKFLSADHDGNLRVTADEFRQKDATNKNPAWQAFQKLDANKDNVIDKAEYVPPKADKAAQSASESEFARFDRDENGKLDIAEFIQTPKSGLSTELRFRWLDTNENGRLELSELTPIYGPKYRQYARVEFWAVSRVGEKDISLEQYKKREAKPARTYQEEFWVRDANDDGALQLTEFAVWDLGPPKPTTKQLFLIFDVDANEKLTVDEFAAVPGVRPDNERVVSDPILDAYQKTRRELQAVLGEVKERTVNDWPTEKVANVFREGSLAAAAVWDLNRDGTITDEEVERGLRIGFCLESATDPALKFRQPSGFVVVLDYIESLDADHDGRFGKDEFITRYYQKKEANEKIFAEMDANQDGFADLAEILRGSWFWNNSLSEFQRIDGDFDGRLSAEELATRSYEWHKSLSAVLLPAFDEDGDGVLSYLEFRRTPSVNRLMNWWATLHDKEADAKLAFAEYHPPVAGKPVLWGGLLRRLMFDHFDRNRNGTLELSEHPFQLNLAIASAETVFQFRDKDGDGKIVWQEFAAGEVAERHAALKQLFVVFDVDADQSLSLLEFRALPGYVRPEQRIVPDPLRDERDKFLASLTAALNKADQNQDRQWSPQEWPEAKILTPIIGEASAVTFPVWDFDGNGSVTEEELQRGAGLAYGLVDPFEGRWPWRSPDGFIFNGIYWKGLDKNRDRKLSREEFLVTYPDKPADGEKRFREIDQNQDGALSLEELFAARWSLIDGAAEFLRFDSDRDGRVSQAELSANIDSWRKSLDAYALPQFDLDGDGQLSFREFRQSLLGDRTLDWRATLTDANGDGHISFSEFLPARTALSPLWMLRQARFVFDRLDRNHDGQIELGEFPFQINLAVASLETLFQFRDKNADGKIDWQEFIIGQPVDRHPALKQLLAVFDTDEDQQFTLAEFRALPGFVRPELQTVSDPILLERDQFLVEIDRVLKKSDSNQDGQWLASEWPSEKELLPILGDAAAVAHAAWDFDKNGTVTVDEIRRGADLAHGVFDPSEGRWPWRFPDGRVFAISSWQPLDKNNDRLVPRDEFLANYYAKGDIAAQHFQQIDRNQDGVASLEELFTSPLFIRDIVGDFLRFDANQNGRLTENELRSKIEDWRKPLADRVFPQFDLDNDGQLNLAEYRRTPLANPVFNWAGAVFDSDGNGRISFDEFFPERRNYGPLWLARMAKLMFERLDRDRNGSLDFSELPFRFNAAVARAEAVFRDRDKNSDNKIDWSELSANEAESRHPALRQLLAVFDVDGDQQLSLTEFKALPGYFRPDARVVPDPMRTARDRLVGELKPILKRSDSDQDGKWSRNEWPKQRELLPILRDTVVTDFKVWDFDGDDTVTQAEIERGADMAFGLIDPIEGKWPFHHPDGRVFNGIHWLGNDRNRDRQLSRDEFMTHYSTNKESSAKVFEELDVDKDGILSAAEVFSGRAYFNDVPADFLACDVNTDGFITPEELTEKVIDWRKRLANNVFPQFDQDGDGKLTLAEFRMLPLGNPVYLWVGTTSDRNGDGLMEFSEFYAERTAFGPLWLHQIARYFFDRLDTNHDEHLSASELDFVGATDPKLAEAGWGPDSFRERYEQLATKTPEWLKRADQNGNGKLSSGEWPIRDIVKELGAEPLAQFSTWDVNSDGNVTLDELNLTLRFALGLSSRASPDVWLRWGNGRLVYWVKFDQIDVNHDGRLSKPEFIENYWGKPEEREQWFLNADTNQDSQLTLQEVLLAGMLFVSPWDAFQRLDIDKDRFISQSELTQNSPSWEKTTVAKVFPAFDADGDGKLSMAEYRQTPLVNPFMAWTTKPADTDYDGYLSLAEFTPKPKTESAAWLTLFCKEFFQRWDRDHDGKLSLAEYDFTVDVARLKPEITFQMRDKDKDGSLTLAELFSDPKPDPANTAAVMAYQTRKIRSEEAFLAADKNSDHKLNQEEHAQYEAHLSAPDEYRTKGRFEAAAAAAIPKAGRAWSWDELLAYGFTGVNLVLAATAGAYWIRKRKKPA